MSLVRLSICQSIRCSTLALACETRWASLASGCGVSPPSWVSRRPSSVLSLPRASYRSTLTFRTTMSCQRAKSPRSLSTKPRSCGWRYPMQQVWSPTASGNRSTTMSPAHVVSPRARVMDGSLLATSLLAAVRNLCSRPGGAALLIRAARTRSVAGCSRKVV